MRAILESPRAQIGSAAVATAYTLTASRLSLVAALKSISPPRLLRAIGCPTHDIAGAPLIRAAVIAAILPRVGLAESEIIRCG